MLSTERRQLVAMRKRLNRQIKHRGSQILNDLDEAHMTLLSDQIVMVEGSIEALLAKNAKWEINLLEKK